MTKRTPCWTLFAFLLWTAACNSQTEPDPINQPDTEALLAAAQQDRLQTYRRLELHRNQVSQLVSEFFAKHPSQELLPEFLTVLEELGVSAQDPESYADAHPGEFLSLATVHAFLQSYPHSSLPPELAGKFEHMGIVPGQPGTYREVDLLEFSRATGGFSWDAHVRQVEAQRTANRRQVKIHSLQGDKQRLSSDLDLQRGRSSQLQLQVGALEDRARGLRQRARNLEGSLQDERRLHGNTRFEKDQLEGHLSDLQKQARRASVEAEERIARLQAQKWRIEEELRRGEHYRTAVAAAQQVVDSYRWMIQDIEQTPFSNDQLNRKWTSFRMQVKYATSLARKTRKKGDTEAARELGANLEYLLRRLPKKFWMQVEAPSGDVYQVSLRPQVEPLIEEIQAWRSL